MNVANLQIEGLTMALASVLQTLVRKNILSIDDVDDALKKAEAALVDKRFYEDLPLPSRDAVCFPIRLLRAANKAQTQDHIPSFSELAKTVGQTKGPYNDQQ